MGLKVDFVKDSLELGVEVGDGAIIKQVIVGGDDGATFFEVFDFTVVAFADFAGIEGAFGTFGNAIIPKMLGSDNTKEDNFAREFVFENFVFGPGIDAVEDDAFLASGDEIFGFGDNLADDPVSTFFLADAFTELAFTISGAFNAAFLHFFEDHATEVDFGDAVFGEIIDDNGFATTAHADDGKDFYIFIIHKMIIA